MDPTLTTCRAISPTHAPPHSIVLKIYVLKLGINPPFLARIKKNKNKTYLGTYRRKLGVFVTQAKCMMPRMKPTK
ncbi:hypothetical protein Hanom_Chr07g00680421 [Helianthus anomalus]